VNKALAVKIVRIGIKIANTTKYNKMKQIKLYLFVVLITQLFFSTSITAANLHKIGVGLKGGFNHTTPIYSTENLTREPEIQYKPQYQYGLSVEFPLNSKFAIVPEIFYEKRFVYVSKIYSYGPEIYPYSFKLNYSLISLPLLLRVNTKVLHRTYLLAGIRFEKILKADEDFADCSGNFRHKNVIDKMPSLSYGIDFGIGYKFAHSSIYFSPELRYVLGIRPSQYEKYSYPILQDSFTNHTIILNIGIVYKKAVHQ
jgi:hypothetical protein